MQQDPVDTIAEIAATQFGYLITTEPPPDPEVLKELAIQLLLTAMTLCEPTYSEVLQQTIEHIVPEDHGIPYTLANQ